MGLSSYVPKKHSEIAKNIYSKYLGLDKKNGLTFQRYIRESTANISPRLRRDFKKIRFDNMAAGLQYFTEELIIQWIKNAIKHTGIKKILLSGGVFMNIKLNKLISELSEVESVNVFPSCGDESNVFGASFLLFNKLTKKRLFPFGPYTLGPLPNINLEEIKKKYSKYCTFTEVENPNYEIAKSLSEGKIIGRCSGRMEFGARALGNRSILADPSSHEIVERVNFLIKQRDFWMPFAPAIRKEDVNEYLKIPDSLKDGRTSPYMMFGFDTTHKRSDMVATIHRSDKTARCEIVHKEIAPDLHEILTFFKKNTGRGVVMNTSLNIHGDPIAMDSNDAIEILINSDLEEIYIENILVKKSKL
jgi:carbamoyltransferase